MNWIINQEEAFTKLLTLKAGAIFMNSSEDKIQLAIELIKSISTEIDFIIWIAPASFFRRSIYKNMIRQHAQDMYCKICFFSIEAISISDCKYLQLYNLSDKYRTFCVVDESLTIKNLEAGRTKRLISIHKKFKYRLILSATPLTQGLVDLYSQIKFIDSNILKMTETQFNRCFLPFYQDDYKNWRRWSTPEDEKALVEFMKPYVFQCDLDDWDYNLEHNHHDFELTEAETKDYQIEKENILGNRDNFPFIEIAQRFQHLYTISQNKVNGLLKLVQQIEKRHEKVIIYTKFLDEVIFLRECGGFAKGHFVELTGKSNKIKAIERFEDDVDIMFCTYRVDRLNLSLRFCNNIIYFSQTFDYNDKIQSLYNLEPKNRSCKIHLYHFWVKTGLEELIRDNLDRKRNVLSNVCNLMSREAALKL